MDRRLIKLHYPLVSILQSFTGDSPTLASNRVYFQSPSSHLMQYPCFRYSLETGTFDHADDTVYTYSDSYQVTYISRYPDNEELRDIVLRSFRYCSYSNRITNDGLYQDNFRIYI